MGRCESHELLRNLVVRQRILGVAARMVDLALQLRAVAEADLDARGPFSRIARIEGRVAVALDDVHHTLDGGIAKIRFRMIRGQGVSSYDRQRCTERHAELRLLDRRWSAFFLGSF